ncbi:hypothetical protein CLU96_0372 [Chryseobacterium sp. 52]|uniref:hypothetical protein n=1 Tax=Chryseobacterium sp. 52 TaxID=2035213 RepID=UPI000C197E86|nr:hypothetical protein [Chryseobacterium sp. 52]PIF43464.1 hypothetical protein CLU96_0372 [Chryseobacterium sp. 52]
MNKLLLIFGFLLAGSWANAQSFTDKALQQTVLQLNNAKTVNDYDSVFNKFSDAKTSERWQSFYYTAVALYLKTELQLKKASGQNLNESNAVARKLAIGALTSQRDNAEINTLIGLLYFQKTQLNGSQDIQQDWDAINQTIAKAEKSAPNNPRLAILKARIKEKSGDKVNADMLSQKALSGFENQNSSDSTSPAWGRQLLQPTK